MGRISLGLSRDYGAVRTGVQCCELEDLCMRRRRAKSLRWELMICSDVSLGSAMRHWGLLLEEAGIGVSLELLCTRPTFESSSALFDLIWVTAEVFCKYADMPHLVVLPLTWLSLHH